MNYYHLRETLLTVSSTQYATQSVCITYIIIAECLAYFSCPATGKSVRVIQDLRRGNHLTLIPDERKGDDKDEKIVGELHQGYILKTLADQHSALDDSDIQILKTYVRCGSRNLNHLLICII